MGHLPRICNLKSHCTITSICTTLKKGGECRWQFLLTLEEQLYMFIPFNQFHMAGKLAGEFVSCIVLQVFGMSKNLA